MSRRGGVRLGNMLRRSLPLLFLLFAACAMMLFSQEPAPQHGGIRACAAAGVEALQNWYSEETGRWNTTEWWNAANGTTVLVRYSRLAPSPALASAIDNTFVKNNQKNFLNKYYDDEGWWALAWLDAFELGHD